MSEYASKGVAGSGLGLGIAGTALGLLNNNGGLGGLLGGNNSQVSALQAELGQIKAERYCDVNAKDTYAQSLADNRALRTEMFGFIKPLSEEAANNRVEIAKLQAEVKCNAEKAELREQIVLGKVNEVALTAKGRFDALDRTIACLAGDVRGITKTVVPNSAICPGWGNVCIETQDCPKM